MVELLHQFGIDWKLLLTQILNFAVVFFVLRRFAYRPVMTALHHRREAIEKGLRAAREAEARLRKVEDEGEAVMAEARQAAREIVRRSEREAEEVLKLAAIQAAKKAEAALQAARRRASREREEMRAEGRKAAAELLTLGIARAVGRMTPNERDDQLAGEVLRELSSLKS